MPRRTAFLRRTMRFLRITGEVRTSRLSSRSSNVVTPCWEDPARGPVLERRGHPRQPSGPGDRGPRSHLVTQWLGALFVSTPPLRCFKFSIDDLSQRLIGTSSPRELGSRLRSTMKPTLGRAELFVRRLASAVAVEEPPACHGIRPASYRPYFDSTNLRLPSANRACRDR
jgi:hypothetical protein